MVVYEFKLFYNIINIFSHNVQYYIIKHINVNTATMNIYNTAQNVFVVTQKVEKKWFFFFNFKDIM